MKTVCYTLYLNVRFNIKDESESIVIFIVDCFDSLLYSWFDTAQYDYACKSPYHPSKQFDTLIITRALTFE